MLRLAYPGWRTLTDLQSEAMWLEALSRDTDIAAPRIVRSRSGQSVLSMSLPGGSSVWHITLMTWVPGRLMGSYLTEDNLSKMGRLFARLHEHGLEWVPPDGFTTRRFEHWLSRDEPNLIIPGGVPGAAEAAEAGGRSTAPPPLPAHHVGLLERTSELVEAAYAAIDRRDLRVIHCDLWHDNIKVHQGRLHPFDFEDTVWGFRAHDIAMAMLDLMEVTDEVRYAELLAAFRRGYEGPGTAWPDDPIEPMQMGRLLWKINWVARHQPEHLAGMVARHAPVFEHLARTSDDSRQRPVAITRLATSTAGRVR
jgi:Ser/Thr protein kinase RdoA (MazF antagonist)